MAWDWMYQGVDHTLEGNGGPLCAMYLGVWRRIFETLFICALATWYISWGFRHLHAPKKLMDNVEQRDRFGKRLLLVLMCLTFGCEIGFKLATKTVIYLLNPCHIVTTIQIYLLATPPSRIVTIVFRCHLHCLNGAVLALAFPVLNTRLLPLEKEVYFIQHIMMLIIPFYLMRIGGVYTLERLGDFSWALVTLGALLFYHFTVLQLLGLLTEVNLNNMLCPAVSDPFRGVNYRIWATGHQSVLISCLGKLYFLISKFILRMLGHKQSLHHLEDFEHHDIKLNRCRGIAQSEIETSKEKLEQQNVSPEKNDQRLDAGDCNNLPTDSFLNRLRNWKNNLWLWNYQVHSSDSDENQKYTVALKSDKKLNTSNGNAEHID